MSDVYTSDLEKQNDELQKKLAMYENNFSLVLSKSLLRIESKKGDTYNLHISLHARIRIRKGNKIDGREVMLTEICRAELVPKTHWVIDINSVTNLVSYKKTEKEIAKYLLHETGYAGYEYEFIGEPLRD